MLQNYNKIFKKTYRILNYTRIKPRSRPPPKKIHIFYAPRFLNGQNRKKKCVNYASKYGNSLLVTAQTLACAGFSSHSRAIFQCFSHTSLTN